MIFIKPLHNNWPCCIIQQVIFQLFGERESEETECKESENEEGESEEGDKSEFELLSERPCSTRSGHDASSFILQFCINILLK